MHPSQINPPVSPSRPESSREEDRYLMRTHKIALRPTRRQRLILKQHADYDRFACNWILRYFKDRFDAGEDYPTSMLFPVWESAKASVCPWGKKLSQSAAKYAVYTRCARRSRPTKTSAATTNFPGSTAGMTRLLSGPTKGLRR